jgi:hypothetical protein
MSAQNASVVMNIVTSVVEITREANAMLSSSSIADKKLHTAFCNCVVSSEMSAIKYVCYDGHILCAHVAPA